MASNSFEQEGYSDHKKTQHAVNMGQQTGYNPVEWRDEHHLHLLREDDDVCIHGTSLFYHANVHE